MYLYKHLHVLLVLTLNSSVHLLPYTTLLLLPTIPTREEGFLAFWKGNSLNVVRIFPYSAAQLASNDSYKRLLAGEGWSRSGGGGKRGGVQGHG